MVPSGPLCVYKSNFESSGYIWGVGFRGAPEGHSRFGWDPAARLWCGPKAARVFPKKPAMDPPYPPGTSASLGLPTLRPALPCVLPFSLEPLISAFGCFQFSDWFFGPPPVL